jgi:predicted MFS family arabinose efflux permease
VQQLSTNKKEIRFALTLAGAIALRMLGLFLILPVFMVMAVDVPGFSPLMGGLAVGIYGLSQAILQQPFGWLSDRWGRRKVMLIGLGLFVAGGVVAASADSMTGIIVGRALQGCGAIAGVAMAFAADLTRAERLPITMAIIGMGIGGSFLLSMMLSVPLAHLLGLRGLLGLTAVLGVVGMLLVLTMPGKQPIQTSSASGPEKMGKALWLLSLSAFVLHMLMTMLFVALPGLLITNHELILQDHWKLYVPSMLLSVLLVFPLVRWLGQHKKGASVIPFAFGLLGLAMLFLPQSSTLVWMNVFLIAYFFGFNALEALMPSQVAIITLQQSRGRKMGHYSTFQFLGAFAGGVGGGSLLANFGGMKALMLAGGLSLLWCLVLVVFRKGLFPTSQPG